MKKILLIFSLFIIFAQFVFANDTQQITRVDVMPSDEEIMEIVKSYHLGADKEEAVFKQTKRKLLEMYEESQISKPAINTNNETEKQVN